MKTTLGTESFNDVQLVERSRHGDREAFGRIVERYQSVVCALTYSACGNLQTSEDLAQVTFITAWCQLSKLQEPAKLKSWLCGMARNVANNSFRRDKRAPTVNAQALDTTDGVPTEAATPRDHVINREEEAILWRSLGELPPTYREPLVLYYRQHQSVAEVADALELSEDVIRQRLSRGRGMLAEKVTAFVEGALRQTTPGRAFTFAVLAALPVMATSAKAAVVGATAAKGAATAVASVGIAGAILGPIIGILGGWFGAKMGIENTQSTRERQFMVKMTRVTLVLVGMFCVAILALVLLARPWWKTHPVLIAAAFIGTLIGYLVALMALILRGNRTLQHIRREEAAKLPPGTLPPGLRMSWPWKVSFQLREYRSRWTVLGLPLIHVRMFCNQKGKVLPAKGWIAVGDTAYGALFACGAVAIAPISFGGFAVGLLTLGGFAVGLLPFGGFSFGPWALGGMAVGWQAFGGCAIGWTAARGGVAVGHEFAEGGVALARHANDAVAQTFFQNSAFFQNALAAMRYVQWLNLIWFLPLVLWWRTIKRARQSSRTS